MDFIENDPFNLTYNFTASINHVPQDFSSHYKTGGILIDSDIACDESYIDELIFQFSVLLIGKRLDRRCVDDSTSVL